MLGQVMKYSVIINICPENIFCARKYFQPPRIFSFAPKNFFICPRKNILCVDFCFLHPENIQCDAACSAPLCLVRVSTLCLRWLSWALVGLRGSLEDVPGLEFPSRPSQTRTPSHYEPLTNGSKRSHDTLSQGTSSPLSRQDMHYDPVYIRFPPFGEIYGP